MEPNLSSNPNDKLKNRSDAERLKVKGASVDMDSMPQDPVYQTRPTTPSTSVGESYEGFMNSNDTGMNSLENSNEYGSRFQMQGAPAHDTYRTPADQQGMDAASPVAAPFAEVQATLKSAEDLLLKIREKLLGNDQKELEDLLRQGSELLTSNWRQVTSLTSSQVSTLSDELKSNPYRGILGALRVGMAISQILSSRSPKSEESHVPMVRENMN